MCQLFSQKLILTTRNKYFIDAYQLQINYLKQFTAMNYQVLSIESVFHPVNKDWNWDVELGLLWLHCCWHYKGQYYLADYIYRLFLEDNIQYISIYYFSLVLFWGPGQNCKGLQKHFFKNRKKKKCTRGESLHKRKIFVHQDY